MLASRVVPAAAFRQTNFELFLHTSKITKDAGYKYIETKAHFC